MYPIKFDPLFFEKIWGGRKMAELGVIPAGNIGERWDIACHKNGVNIVANGLFKGMRFDELIEKEQKLLLGTAIKTARFPLLIKLIDAREKLSLQVHPGDEYARKHEGDLGKTEAWYVLEAEPGAELIVGLKKGCTITSFSTALLAGSSENLLNKMAVSKGDIFCIESGMVHAIGKGVLIAEIQQNSDVTYRIDDYGRGRELHLDKAWDVIDPKLQGDISIDDSAVGVKKICCTEHFSMELCNIESWIADCSNRERFYTITCVEGSGVIKYHGKAGSVSIGYGESVFIPASLGMYRLEGKMKVIKSYISE